MSWLECKCWRSERGGHFVLGILDLIIMAVIAWTSRHLGPLFPPTCRPLAHLTLHLTSHTPAITFSTAVSVHMVTNKYETIIIIPRQQQPMHGIGWSVASVILCLSVCPHSKMKMAWAINTKLGTHILHGSCSASIDPKVKRSKVKVTWLRKPSRSHACYWLLWPCAAAAVWLLKFIVSVKNACPVW